ncbi:Adenylate isopentenyltransferase [Datura stramonium]|uniref:Adenylate isopentenyltransferase n=1 Tax=Datura stramonium TaxID=4076 RepID=A0ABS8VA53_DATST|nr:Adenylate isopentenyltransferase [Datura stramonium]
MSATGLGKSKFSIDLVTRFFSSKIINSDKIQVFKYLNITFNKISLPKSRGVVHHLLSEFFPSESHLEFSTLIDFREELRVQAGRGRTRRVNGEQRRDFSETHVELERNLRIL